VLRSKNAELRTASDQLVALLNVKAGDAYRIGGEANKRAGELEKEAAKLREANEKAEAKLEGEKQKRLELAASLLPRELRDEVGTVKALSALPPVKVRFEYREEEELRQIAEEIHAVVAASKWKAWRKKGNEWRIREGITVSPGVRPPENGDWSLWPEQEKSTWEACEGIVKALSDKGPGGLDVEIGNSALDLSPGTILISIGTKPNHAVEDAIRELAKPPGAQHPTGPRGTRLGIPDEEPAKPYPIQLK
jgi:hypothetical protein